MKKLFENVGENQFRPVKEAMKHMSDDELKTMVDTMVVTKQPELMVHVIKELAYRMMNRYSIK